MARSLSVPEISDAAERQELLNAADHLSSLLAELRKTESSMQQMPEPERFVLHSALDELEECLSWVWWQGWVAPTADVRRHVGQARYHAWRVLELLEELDAPSPRSA
jgi:hypothetical protein